MFTLLIHALYTLFYRPHRCLQFVLCLARIATMRTIVFAAALALFSPALAASPMLFQKRGGMKSYHHPNVSAISEGLFDQLLDHRNTSFGTFKQRYWYDAQYWQGPGSPVFLFNVGEEAADNFTGYLYN